MKLLRLLLLPFSLIYVVVIVLRNAAYDAGLFTSRKFSIPVISVGNLAVGGAGKSPMAEYLVRLLKDRYKIATLSRGYGRKTSGFIELTEASTTIDAGDEPVQFKHKFPSITVAVCEKRAAGIEILQKSNDLIILDDAYQHRSVKPGLSLLLFDYSSIFQPQYILPAGNLREPLSGRKRADVIIVTKTPDLLSEAEREKIAVRIAPYPNQELFFSYLEYGDLEPLNNGQKLPLSTLNKETDIILLTGIANPATLLDHLTQYTSRIVHHNYPDHHPFSTKNIAKLAAAWSASKAKHKFIITTEKDAQRLRSAELNELLRILPVYYLPVSAKIHKPQEERFNQIIEQYVAKHL
ncbi:MAG TPA: tetraacyldisaccharide 4'-kinase [Sphingobacteriaceae bacterium]|nr:tetraacyldisaccharide 4'-kinase [Sphingobacteriaceae bacterium]